MTHSARLLAVLALACTAAGPADRYPQPVAAGQLLHRTVLEPVESQTVLGHVEQIVRMPDGTVSAVVSYGGVLGIGSRLIAVPVGAMTLLGPYMEIVDFTPQQLDAFPAFQPASAPAVAPDDIVRVGLSRPSH